MIANTGLPQGHFKRSRLLVSAEENGLVFPRNSPAQTGEFNLLDDGPRLILIGGKSIKADFCSLAVLRPELFSPPAGIVLDQSVGRLENCIGRTIVLFELDDFDLPIMLLQIEQVGDFCPSPAVDAL